MKASTPHNFRQFDSNYWFQKPNSSSNGLSQEAAGKILKQTTKTKKIKSHFQKNIWYSDKSCVEPHRNTENIARNTVCHIFLCGLYLAPLKLSEHQKTDKIKAK